MNLIKDKELLNVIKDNPHIGQSILYNDHILKETIPKRKMKASDKEENYRRRTDDSKTVLHWGQRKLFLSELEFLSLYSKEGDIVIYVGSAPGNHTFFLTLLFPYISKFILFDPSPFYIKETSKVMIINDFFRPKHIKEIIKKYPSNKLLFISDIRSATSLESEDIIDKKVKFDMALQMEWVLKLKPRKSMLKFRLPWHEGNTKYLDGDIYYQAWGPSTTTETRLITSGKKLKLYSNKLYERKMFYFNTKTRTNFYNHSIKNVKGLDHCYDCASEVLIWKEYIKNYTDIWLSMKKYIIELIQIRKLNTKNDDKNQPSNKEINLMKNLSNKIFKIKNLNKKLTIKEINSEISEAIEMTHFICSKYRNFQSKILDPKYRNWFPKKIIENEKIIFLKEEN